MKTKLLIILLLPLTCLSQTPGGVSSNLTWWLKSDAGITQSSGVVSQWNNQTGSSAVNVSATGSQQPVNNLILFNYYPVVTFDSTDDAMRSSIGISATSFFAMTTGSSSATTGSLFIVSRVYNPASKNIMSQFPNPGCGNYAIRLTTSGTGDLQVGGRSSTTGTIVLANNKKPFIASALETSGANNALHYKDGGNLQTTSNSTLNMCSADQQMRIGNTMGGDIAEIITYNVKLTDAERIKIESYLAIKYGITLTNTNGGTIGDYVSSGGTTIWDADDNSSYHNNVIGIGSDATNSGLIQKQSQQWDDSTRIYVGALAVNNAANGTSITNGQFVMMGNNNQPLRHTYGLHEYPVGLGIYTRLDREWKITNTNFNGTFSLDIKLNTTPVTAADLRVLIDDNGDFTDATLFNPTISYNAGIVTISGISTAMIPMGSTKYLTIASMNSTTPLPVGLKEFTARPVDNKYVQLNWQTATETNNDYFAIERSVDGFNWQEIGKVKGAGNSTLLLSYAYIDVNPAKGISYYRLKQTDYDGQNSLSPVRTITIDFSHANQLKLYPNPATNYVTIEGVFDNVSGVTIYDAMGRNVSRDIKTTAADNRKLIVDVAKLPPGIYLVCAGNSSTRLYKQ